MLFELCRAQRQQNMYECNGQLHAADVCLLKSKEQPFQMYDTPSGSCEMCNNNRWIIWETLLVWLNKFVEYSHPSLKEMKSLNPRWSFISHQKYQAHLLILISISRDNNDIILCFPLHTTYCLQPLDVSFMRPFLYYQEEMRKWPITHHGNRVTIY